MSSFTLRVPDELHVKARILGAFKGLSLNEVCVRGIQSYVQNWEKNHGEIPRPPEDDD
jgi:predicted HicB family RNase H-like nuclease